MSKRFIGSRQTTIGREIELSGTGVHSGAPVSMLLHPAEADTGYRFLVSKRGRIIAEIPADVCHVKNLTLCTVLGDESGTTISTVEHLLAALRGLNVDNCYIEIDAREVPIMDGSAGAFVEGIDEVGIRELSQPRKFIKVLKPIRVQEGDCWGELSPHSSFHLDVEIDFPTPLIGRQRMAMEVSSGAFRNEIARARTFGFMRDVENLWKAGLALGASLNNTIALADDRIMNADGLRYPQEFVRHKMLDAIGDLALAGAPMLGAYRSVRGGHRLNAHVVQALLADKEAWAMVRTPWVREAAPVPVDVSVGVPAAVSYAAERT
jgi:UDP-3-O-[3-hydroxymyristoyl] N-acetylglucosamine deacetylase